MFIYNWLCMVTDFIGVFVTLSWAFYHPASSMSNANEQRITLFGQIWMYKVLCSSFTIAVTCCFGVLCLASSFVSHVAFFFFLSFFLAFFLLLYYFLIQSKNILIKKGKNKMKIKYNTKVIYIIHIAANGIGKF